jgi:hypothetical protein
MHGHIASDSATDESAQARCLPALCLRADRAVIKSDEERFVRRTRRHDTLRRRIRSDTLGDVRVFCSWLHGLLLPIIMYKYKAYFVPTCQRKWNFSKKHKKSPFLIFLSGLFRDIEKPKR